MRPGEIAHNVSRSIFWLAVEKVAGLLSGIVYFALLLRWLGPTKYGIITLALSFAGLATIATGNFEVFLERYAAEYQATGRLATLRAAHRLALGLKLALGLVASAILALLAPLLAVHFQMPELAFLLPVLAVLVACDGLSMTGRATLYGLQEFRWLCLLAVVFHIAKTAMVGLLWWFHKGLPELALGLAALILLQSLATSAVPAWMLWRGRDPAGEPPPRGKELMRAVLGYSVPLLGARAAFLAGQNLGKVVLGKLFTASELGLFSFAFQTVERFVELVHTVPSSLLPSLTQLVARGERERLRWVFDQAFRLIQVVACMLSFGVFVFAPELTLLVGSPLFVRAIPLLRIMALVPIARTAQQPLTMLFQALRLPGTILWLALLKLAVEFGGYFTLVPALGLAGAGWANLAGAVAAYAAALVGLARLLPEGAGERLRAVLRSVALVLPLFALALWAEVAWPAPASLAARALLVPLGGFALFALGLVNRYDLEKVSSVPLKVAWMRRVRDSAVATADRVARVLSPKGA
jgi:O-antigen/teichoic acid export membrane protein